MADKNYFNTTSARSLTVRGASGQSYKFGPVTKVAVNPQDAPAFRQHPALMEVDEDGNDMRPVVPSAAPKPKSYTKLQVPQRVTTAPRRTR